MMPANDDICPHQQLELALIDACEQSGLPPTTCIAVMGMMVGGMLYSLPDNPVEVLQMWYANVTIGNARAVSMAAVNETRQ